MPGRTVAAAEQLGEGMQRLLTQLVLHIHRSERDAAAVIMIFVSDACQWFIYTYFDYMTRWLPGLCPCCVA